MTAFITGIGFGVGFWMIAIPVMLCSRAKNTDVELLECWRINNENQGRQIELLRDLVDVIERHK